MWLGDLGTPLTSSQWTQVYLPIFTRLGRQLGRNLGKVEYEVVRHISQRLGVHIVRDNAAMMANRHPTFPRPRSWRWPRLICLFCDQIDNSYYHIMDQREWVFEVQELKSEKEKLSLFFEKWKVKSKCFEIEKWKFSRILNNSRETRFFNRFIPWQPNKTAETDGLSVG